MRSNFRIQPDIDRECAIGRNKDRQEAEKTDQVVVIEICPFIQQKCVTEAEKKQGRAQAVEKTGRNKQPEHAQDCPVNIHPVARPRLDPGESIILEEKWRFNPLGRDPTMRVVPPNLPSHEKAECDSEKNQRGGVDRRERLLLQVR